MCAMVKVSVAFPPRSFSAIVVTASPLGRLAPQC
jgi:hypothetical protein